MMAQNILRYFREFGHETTVLCTAESPDTEWWEFDGTLCCVPERGRAAELRLDAIKPDLILTHHQCTPQAVTYGRHMNIPVVQIIHNDMDVSKRYLKLGADYVIYNTNWIKDKFDAIYNLPSCVLHPPVYSIDHRAEPGDLVTLVNLNAHKGARILYALADRMPDVKFLAVEGGHGIQIFETWPNVTHQKQTTNMREDVWARTKILLMPSIYESYGMASVEALASGIPVIANPTPGLRESLGSAGIFVDRDDIDGWEREIRHLLNDSNRWQMQSDLATQRSSELDPSEELKNVVSNLEELVWRTQQ